MGSPNKFSPQKNCQNHLFFGQFSLSIDIYIQTYFNIYLVLVLASKSISPIHFNPCRFICRLPCVIIHKKMKTYISEKQNYNSSAAQRRNKYTFLSQLSVIDTRNKLVIFFEEIYVFIFCYVIPKRAALTEPPSRLK